MDHLSVLHVMVVSSATIQFVALFLSVFLYSRLKDKTKRAFLWLSISFALVIIRRILAMARYSIWSIPTLEIEYTVTFIASILWIAFLIDFIKGSNGRFLPKNSS